MVHHLKHLFSEVAGMSVKQQPAPFSVLPLFCSLILQVAGLFRRHDDLLQEFTYFLPDSTAPAAQHVRLMAQFDTDALTILRLFSQFEPRTLRAKLLHGSVIPFHL